ncbi:hypothetical protein FKO01_25345 [Mesorhizobium sp. B2-3-3]|nr:hypothetical protein FKO01_25345 [Mesorhizobium sp. B2-3-3]
MSTKSQKRVREITEEAMAAKRAAGLKFTTPRSVDESAKRLMALIPHDTRNMTQRTFGDHLPGSSALDRLRGSA